MAEFKILDSILSSFSYHRVFFANSHEIVESKRSRSHFRARGLPNFFRDGTLWQAFKYPDFKSVVQLLDSRIFLENEMWVICDSRFCKKVFQL